MKILIKCNLINKIPLFPKNLLKLVTISVKLIENGFQFS